MAGGGIGGEGHQPWKVVFIDTQYVQTDEESFKSVVQRLTGREEESRASISNACKNPDPSRDNNHERGSNVAVETLEAWSSVFLRNYSFNELERLLNDTPFPPNYELWK